MKKLFLLLLLAANICFAQAIIEGDPAEPCGPIRSDYWIGRHDRLSPIRGEVGACTERCTVPDCGEQCRTVEGQSQSEGSKPRQQTKAFTAAVLDSYVFYTNVRVNDDPPGTSFKSPYSSGGHAMAVRGDTVYLVWRDDRNGTSTIFFDKSVDGGNTWGTDIKVNDGDSGAVMPALALGNDGTIYVSWTDFRDITRHIYFAKSTDGGQAFNPAVRVQTATEEKQQYSSIAVNDSGYIFIAYEDFRNLVTTAKDIYCSRSINGGSSFETAVRVEDCPDSVSQQDACITVRDSSVFICWTDFRDTISYSNVYYTKSSNYGISYYSSIIINDTIGLPKHAAARPSIVVNDSGLIYVAWGDTRNDSGISDIYFTQSFDNGLSFHKPNINIVDAGGIGNYQGYPSLCCDDSGGVYCAWEDRRNGSAYPWLIYFNYSKNFGDSFATNNIHVDDINIGLSPDVQLGAPTICVNNAGKVFCAWDDNRVNGGLLNDIYATAGYFTGVEGAPDEKAVLLRSTIKAFPNPFAQTIQIAYVLPKSTNIMLGVYNIAGQLVKVLDQGYKTAGDHKVNWNHNQSCSEGIYFVCLSNGNKSITQKIIKIK